MGDENTMREDMEAAIESLADGEAEAPVETAAAVPEEPKADAAPAPDEKAPEPVSKEKPDDAKPEGVKAPAGWTPAAREQFGTLPAEIQTLINKRELEINHALNEGAADRKMGTAFNQLMRPYASLMASEGTNDPMVAVQNLMNTAAQLSMGSPQQKASRMAQLIQHYGIDINMLDNALVGNGASNDPQQNKLEQMIRFNPEQAAKLISDNQSTLFEERLRRSRPLTPDQQMQNVPGVGLVNISDPNNPYVAIAGQEGPEQIFNIGGESELEYNVQQAKHGVPAINALQEGINSRNQQIGLLDNILAVSDEAPSGPLANIELFAGQMGQIFGIDTEGVAAGEIFRGMSNNLALLVRGNPEGGLPGAASNRDVTFLLNSGPTLAQTKQGRKALAKVSKEAINYRNRLARAEQNYRNKNLGSVVGFDPNSVEKPDIASIVEEARSIVSEGNKDRSVLRKYDPMTGRFK